MTKRQGYLLTGVFIVVAAFLRFWLLENKPIHFDESINMWFVNRIWEDGFFRYDPTNYHGPLYFYAIQFVQLFTGPDFISTRITASIFSFLTLVVLWWGPVQHRVALRWAALLLLLSPAIGFYGRSGIHESVFVFFQVLGFLSFHYLAGKEYRKFWLSFAAGLLGMMALKETFLILIVAWVPAALVGWFFGGSRTPLKVWINDLKTSLSDKCVYAPLSLMLFLFVGLYSGFGQNPKGLADFFIALMPWLKTGVEGAGHQKEFLHWTKLMVAYESPILAGFALGVFYLRRNPWVRFYTIISFIVWLVYSWIPYKTPWCFVSLLWPFALVGGFALQEVFQQKKVWIKASVGAVMVILQALTLVYMYQLEFKDPIDMNHPYVYVNSTYPMKEFITKVQQKMEDNPLLKEQTIQISTDESWPFPIVFGKSYGLNYFKIPQQVAVDAMIYMIDPVDKAALETEIQSRGQTAEYAVFKLDFRQGRASALIYVKKSVFNGVFSWPLSEIGSL